jgi:hypothetical protein
MGHSNDLRFGVFAAATFVLGGIAASACTAEVQARPAVVESEIEEVEAPPPYVETYPQTYYEGRVVYLVNDRWYYQRRGRWVYYRTEPPELVRQRSYVQQAPPARGVVAPYGGGPPPARRTR